MENLARESGREFKNLSREQMEALWDLAKGTEQKIERSGAQTKR
jgi:uncharacterized protein YabN with tetrapyrrole methylase and pyrophosphatase domain